MTAADKVRARCVETDGCLVWQGAKTRKGYGRVFWKGRGHYTHRIMFEAANGSVPDGSQIDHLCRNTSCCNPAHLEAVTSAENTRRGRSLEAAHRRKNSAKSCPRGHPFTAENSYIDRRGNRSCRTCRKAQHAAYSQLRKDRVYRTLTAQRGNGAPASMEVKL